MFFGTAFLGLVFLGLIIFGTGAIHGGRAFFRGPRLFSIYVIPAEKAEHGLLHLRLLPR
jgi:hypothetical protein